MISVSPQGAVYICKTPLENDYKNQLTFANKTAQTNYFNSKINFTFDSYTYIKKDNVIKVGINIDQIMDCNYLFYKNNGFLDDQNNVRTFYCFITNKEYINENCTALTIETDCFQTWYFDIVYNRCFVEREHVNDDTIGHHTVDEGLDTGEYINVQAKHVELNNPADYGICMAVTELPDESLPTYTNNRAYNGIFGGLYYLYFSTPAYAENAVKIYDEKGKADAISYMFMIPKTLTNITNGTTVQWTLTQGQTVLYTTTLTYLSATMGSDLFKTISVSRPDHVGQSFTPKNNKLFVYPYSYMEVTNNAGVNGIFRYEDFTDVSNIRFNIETTICPGMSMKAIPLNYKWQAFNFNSGITLGKLPICSWNSDVYTNWLTQQGVNNSLQMASGAISAIAGIATGNIGGATGGLMGIFGAMQQRYIADLTPNQARGNTNNGDINFSYSGDGGLTFHYMSVRNEMAQIIDDYFTMFGYKVNSVKVPNITGRTYWNYVKTIDCNFDGDIPQSDLNTIKNMFNSGITLWHDPTKMYDYSQNNTIVS